MLSEHLKLVKTLLRILQVENSDLRLFVLYRFPEVQQLLQFEVYFVALLTYLVGLSRLRIRLFGQVALQLLLKQKRKQGQLSVNWLRSLSLRLATELEKSLMKHFFL